ncbi:hypothetical protein C5E45_23680 [Nocardia nova]|uniref:AbiTii domain-containing protein n=1 Tax=Nocardia nova TaxID=37330 RepID=A0A2S6AKR9_9NOCA|nr:hypothetical protein [Nocardia nova]PPJ35814.1 hypothetical protein C5E45_23680 [Nocardia nova]
MTDVDQILALTRKALDDFDTPGKSVTGVVRQAYRIAVRRHDYGEQNWFLLQLSDLGSNASDRDAFRDLQRRLEALLGPDQARREERRQMSRYLTTRLMANGKDHSGSSVEQLEAQLAQIEAVYTSYGQVPTNLTPIDTYFVAQKHDSQQAELLPLLDQHRTMLSRIRQAVHAYLVKTESELEEGRSESSFFDQVQARGNELLTKYAPEAARNFVAAQERIASGGPEDISHALTSCRRMIKSLADALYPASGEMAAGADNVERKMSEDAYKNRLLQYVGEQVGKHKNGAVLQAVIAELGSRLTALDALASKGVHANPSIDEARTCVAQTYLLAADLLSIAEGSSYLMQDEDQSDSAPEPDAA